jgi:AI-2 transport protein TqsA
METLPEITRRVVAIAAVVVIAAGMHVAAPYLVQILLAAFLAIITQPLVDHLRKRGWPMAVILSAAGVFLAGVTILGGLLAADGLRSLVDKAPKYQEALLREFHGMTSWISTFGIDIPANAIDQVIAPSAIIGALKASLGATTTVLGQTFAIVLLVIFMWLEAPSLPKRLKPHLDADNHARLAHNLLDLRRYMALKAVMSLLTGVLVFVWCLAMGIPFAALLGLAAFVLNFVPVVGSIIASLPALVIALVDHGPGYLGIVTIGYAVINIGISNGLEPRVLGRGLGLSPLAVVLSLFVWGWILGPAGMLLAVPLTMAIRALLKGVHGCEAWVAFLGNGEPNMHTKMWRRQHEQQQQQ